MFSSETTKKNKLFINTTLESIYQNEEKKNLVLY